WRGALHVGVDLIGRSELLVRDCVDGDCPFHGILSYGVRHVDDVSHGWGGVLWSRYNTINGRIATSRVRNLTGASREQNALKLPRVLQCRRGDRDLENGTNLCVETLDLPSHAKSLRDRLLWPYDRLFKVADIRQDRVDRLQTAANHAAQRAVDRSQTGCQDCATRTRNLSLDVPRRNEHCQEQGYRGQYGVTAYPPAHVDTSGLHLASPLVELISHVRFLLICAEERWSCCFAVDR